MPFDNLQEQFYLVDKNDHPQGPIARKKANSSPQFIHRSVCILIFNIQDQLLLQKRAPNKDTHPNFWTLSVTGHVTYGQTYLQAAKRELAEEMGLKAPLKRLTKMLLTMPQETEYSTIYQTKVTQNTINPDEAEVSSIKWVSIDQLPIFVKENPTTPDAVQILTYLKYL